MCPAQGQSPSCAANKPSQFRKSDAENAEEILMRRQILGVATVLALVGGATSNATAFDQGPGSGSHAGRIRAGGMHGIGARHGSRFEGVRGFERWRERGWSHGGAHS